jgi:hypothetical protein
MRQRAKPTRQNRTITVDFQEPSTYLAQTQHLNHEPQTAWNSLSHNGL